MAEFTKAAKSSAASKKSGPLKTDVEGDSGNYYDDEYDDYDDYSNTSRRSSSHERMNLGNIDGTTWKGRGNAACKKASATSTNHTGRDDRATTEQVMDPRTRMILFKLLSTGFLDEIHGCISTGKEANVYYAKAGDSGYAMMQRAAELQEGLTTAKDRDPSGSHDLAVKIFKTSILVFKDRDRYISGEHRFRHGYCKSNPRKMVKIWAEKEMRNLKRLTSCGVRCPVPILIKNNVLIMRFIGKNGWGAPRLRDAGLDIKRLRSCYSQCIRMMRNMYQKAGLVHGDLSEYNMLYQKGLLYFIDVSQSVEEDHPRALDFLRMDCKNVTDFFRKVRPELSKKDKAKLQEEASAQSLTANSLGTRERMGQARLEPLSVVALFNFITDSNLADEDVDEYLDKSAESGGTTSEQTAQDKVDEAVFMKAFIPRSLGQVHDFEQEHERVMQGEGESVYVNSVAGLVGGDNGGDSKTASLAEKKGSSLDDGTDIDSTKLENDEDEDEFSEEYLRKKKERMRRKDLKKEGKLVGEVGTSDFQIKSTKDKALRREHKKLVKLEKAERRKKKIPKHIKKKAMKGKSVKGKKSR